MGFVGIDEFLLIPLLNDVKSSFLVFLRLLEVFLVLQNNLVVIQFLHIHYNSPDKGLLEQIPSL